VEEEHGEKRTRLGPAQRYLAALVPRLERSQDSKLHLAGLLPGTLPAVARLKRACNTRSATSGQAIVIIGDVSMTEGPSSPISRVTDGGTLDWLDGDTFIVKPGKQLHREPGPSSDLQRHRRNWWASPSPELIGGRVT
jgi:hypothetical protein